MISIFSQPNKTIFIAKTTVHAELNWQECEDRMEKIEESLPKNFYLQDMAYLTDRAIEAIRDKVKEDLWKKEK